MEVKAASPQGQQGSDQNFQDSRDIEAVVLHTDPIGKQSGHREEPPYSGHTVRPRGQGPPKKSSAKLTKSGENVHEVTLSGRRAQRVYCGCRTGGGERGGELWVVLGKMDFAPRLAA